MLSRHARLLERASILALTSTERAKHGVIIAKGNRVGTVSIEGLEWQEVDFPQDVEAADALTAKWVEEGRYAK